MKRGFYSPFLLYIPWNVLNLSSSAIQTVFFPFFQTIDLQIVGKMLIEEEHDLIFI